MKTKSLLKLTFVIIAICSLLYSCDNQKIEFTQTKTSNIKGYSDIVSVTGYNLRFNPKGKGTIIFQLENQEEYTASKLTAPQLASLAQLLENSNLKFDLTNKEFVLNN